MRQRVCHRGEEKSEKGCEKRRPVLVGRHGIKAERVCLGKALLQRLLHLQDNRVKSLVFAEKQVGDLLCAEAPSGMFALRLGLVDLNICEVEGHSRRCTSLRLGHEIVGGGVERTGVEASVVEGDLWERCVALIGQLIELRIHLHQNHPV